MFDMFRVVMCLAKNFLNHISRGINTFNERVCTKRGAKLREYRKIPSILYHFPTALQCRESETAFMPY